MASLDHPNIVKLKEALEDEVSKKIYLVMEYCSRGSILSKNFWNAQKILKNTFLEEESPATKDNLPRLTLFQAKRYFSAILKGLDYRNIYITEVHNERGIVHHDIKPENILVDNSDVAKLTDFGISVKLNENGDDEMHNHEYGTKLYLPPESWSSSLQPYARVYDARKSYGCLGSGVHFLPTDLQQFPLRQLSTYYGDKEEHSKR